MEAELTALREELSTRSKNNNGTNGTKQPVTNHSNIANGNENSSSENESVMKKPEKQNTEVKEEQKNWSNGMTNPWKLTRIIQIA